jgi:hypothetical protein
MSEFCPENCLSKRFQVAPIFPTNNSKVKILVDGCSEHNNIRYHRHRKMAPATEETTLLPLATRPTARPAPGFPFLVDCFCCCLSPKQKGCCLLHPKKSDAFALLSLLFAALTFYYSIGGMSITVAVLGCSCAAMAYCNHHVSSYQTAVMKEDIATIKEDIKQLPSLTAIEATVRKLMFGDEPKLRKPDDLLKNPRSNQLPVELQEPEDHLDDSHGQPDDNTTFDDIIAPGKSVGNDLNLHEHTVV